MEKKNSMSKWHAIVDVGRIIFMNKIVDLAARMLWKNPCIQQ